MLMFNMLQSWLANTDHNNLKITRVHVEVTRRWCRSVGQSSVDSSSIARHPSSYARVSVPLIPGYRFQGIKSRESLDDDLIAGASWYVDVHPCVRICAHGARARARQCATGAWSSLLCVRCVCVRVRRTRTLYVCVRVCVYTFSIYSSRSIVYWQAVRFIGSLRYPFHNWYAIPSKLPRHNVTAVHYTYTIRRAAYTVHYMTYGVQCTPYALIHWAELELKWYIIRYE